MESSQSVKLSKCSPFTPLSSNRSSFEQSFHCEELNCWLFRPEALFHAYVSATLRLYCTSDLSWCAVNPLYCARGSDNRSPSGSPSGVKSGGFVRRVAVFHR